MIKELTSVNNKLVKDLLQLRDKSRERKKHGEFVFEGLRELELSLKGGYELIRVLFNPKIISLVDLKKVLLDSHAEIISVGDEVYKKLAYRESTEGVIIHAKSKDHKLSTARVIKGSKPLILVAEGTEKPGNLGAMLRTADAANLDFVILADPKSDIYNSNLIRSSVGCVFTNNIYEASSQEVVEWLKKNEICIYSAALSASLPYDEVDYTLPCAIAVGTEATGLTSVWTDNSVGNIIIPMEGQIDSMNVSVSAAIIIFEAKRQRKVKA